MSGTSAEREHREALRRRLYRPGATEEDRRRFAQLAADPVPIADPRVPAAPVRRPARRLAVAATAAAALIAVVGLALTMRPATPTESASAAQPAEAQAVSTQEAVQADLVATTPDSPQATPVATTVAGVPTRLQRFHGRGSAVVAIDTREAQRADGTMLVMLTAASSDPMSWYATRASTGPDRAAYAQVVARSDDRFDPRDPPEYSICQYDGAPPTRLSVSDSGTGAWTLTIAFLPRRSLPY